MKRRQLLLCGGATIGGASILGTGAFTSVSAERTVSVAVAGDASAFLGLDATTAANGAYASEQGDDGELVLDFGDISSGRDETVTDGGEGVNANAVTTVGDVFRVRNQGTQPVEVDLKETSNANYDEKVLHAQDPWSPKHGETEATLDDDDDVFIYFQSVDVENSPENSPYNYDKYGHNEVRLDAGQEVGVWVKIFASPDSDFDISGNLQIEASAVEVDGDEAGSGDASQPS